MKKLLILPILVDRILLMLIAINFIASAVHFRYDLTEEKRYTLSKPTKQLLQNLNDQVYITVFLDRRHAGWIQEII